MEIDMVPRAQTRDENVNVVIERMDNYFSEAIRALSNGDLQTATDMAKKLNQEYISFIDIHSSTTGVGDVFIENSTLKIEELESKIGRLN